MGRVLAAADAERGAPWPQTTASSWARIHRDGNRTAHEALVFARSQRLTRAVVAAWLTDDADDADDADAAGDARLDEVADGVLAWCEQTSWCWPAHDDARTRTGALLPDPTRPYLDLGAGEVAGQLAWTDHLLGDRLDVRWPGLRARLRHEVGTRVLRPFRERRDWHWLGLDGDVHNWNPWIHGNVLAAALALLDGPDDAAERAATVALALQGLDRYVAALPDDGGVDEGFDYWWNGACRALEALELVRGATGGALDWAAVPRLRATLAFPAAMHLGGAWHVAFADSRARTVDDRPWHALFAAARHAGDDGAAAYGVRLSRATELAGQPACDERSGLGRLVQAVADGAWWTARAAAPEGLAEAPGATWLPSLQVLLARPTAAGGGRLTLAVKGGHNGEHHNHCDVGSVVVALDGVPVVVDPGRPTYTAQTFGPRRYELWPMTSGWHSVPVLRGVGQAPGAGCAARDVALHPGGLTLDLARAYPGSGLARWRRTARLDPDDGSVQVTDAWELDPGEPPGARPSAVHWVLAGRVALDAAAGLAAVTALDGAGTARLTWDPAAVTAASLTERPLDDPMLSEVWGPHLTRLRLDLPPTGRGEVAVRVATG